MDLIRPISRYLAVPLFALRNRNRDYRFVAEAERAQYLPVSDLRHAQLENLRRLLVHARDNCPFYTERFAEAGFIPEKMTSTADITVLPPITKQDIQQHRDRMIARNIPRDALISNQTGGSTGAPLKFYHDSDCIHRRFAGTLRHDRWAGLELWDKAASIWGNRRDFLAPTGTLSKLRNRLLNRRVILDTSNITAANLAEFVAALATEKPTVYIAYANAIYLIARYIRERRLTDYHRPASIITSAELLTEEQRQVIESVFGCPVFDRYGCRETSVIASECDHHAGLHLCADRLHVEFLKGATPCRPDELGNIVITDLFNFGMPFIRYQIRDMGSYSDRACACGRTLPLMNMVGGRVTDFLVTPDGTVVSGAAMTIYFVAHVPGAAQAQLVQKERDRLVIRMVTNEAYGPASETSIREAVLKFFGSRMRYDIELVEDIPVEASGKYRFSISEIDPLECLL
jgi:phenylacetate-CoA ligase